MKLKVRRASSGYSNVIDEIEMNTIEDLMNYIDDLGEDIIIEEFQKEKSILIYDTYIE